MAKVSLIMQSGSVWCHSALTCNSHAHHPWSGCKPTLGLLLGMPITSRVPDGVAQTRVALHMLHMHDAHYSRGALPHSECA
jgi:hypothetical protein